ncbi:AAA family ATPase, partial [Candidatus Dojkabacteria bacterium]|nr:AAA family ATPase [Candidatus Dojkabacteria bacterium]
MIIDKLKINNFKKFSDLEVEFSRGINIVVGPNETGKSTLTRALIEAIYADPTTKSKTFYDQISPWNKANDLKLELEFHNNDAKFRLKKDFQAKSIIFENLDTGLKLTSFKEVSEAIKELTGIPTKEIYESTAFVKQSDIASIDNSNDFIASVQKAASSNSVKVNVHNVMSELSKELKKLNVGVNNPAKHPGPIKQVTDKLKELKAELADKSVKWEKINTESVSKKQYDTELVDIDESIKVTETLIENYRKRKEALKQLEVINKQILQTEEKINSVSEAAQKRDAIKANLAKYERFQSVDVNAIDQEVGELSAAKKVIAGELERLTGLLEQVKNKKIKKSSNTQLVFAGAIALA